MKIENNTPVAYDLSSTDYFNLFTHVSRSEMFKSLRSENGIFEPMAETKSLTFGRAFHTIVLEPEKFKSEFYVQEEGKRLNKQMKEEAGRRGILTFKEFMLAKHMQASIMCDPFFGELMEDDNTLLEKCFFSSDDESNLDLKVKLDVAHVGRNIICDLKSIRSCTHREINNSIRDYNLLGQAYFYTKVMRQCYDKDFEFYFAFVEKTSPNPATAVVKIEERYIQNIGQKLFNMASERYKEQTARGAGFVNNQTLTLTELIEGL